MPTILATWEESEIRRIEVLRPDQANILRDPIFKITQPNKGTDRVVQVVEYLPSKAPEFKPQSH
jgi:hypothetical protein